VLLIVSITYLLLVVFCPFFLWRSFFVVAREVIRSRDVTLNQKRGMVWHLCKELIYAPFFTVLWHIDDILFFRFARQNLAKPVFIMSQPRSGTTFLLRTLSLDTSTFFSLTHLGWRFPFIALWKILDIFGLRKLVERINYWPNTELGRLASKIHEHRLGSVEEHGIFFEERMYHHYFTFRRFPFIKVLQRVTNVETLSERERRKILRTFRKVVQKVAYYRGAGRVWLTKENESIDLYKLLHGEFNDAYFVAIVRPPDEFVSSYVTMSDICTKAKHGVDPHRIASWDKENIEFRKDECLKLIGFCKELEQHNAISYLTFELFTKEILRTVERIYAAIGVPLSSDYARLLADIQAKQDRRDSGYVNAPHSVEGFAFFDAFVANIGASASERGLAAQRTL
jgi:omega-hydroxy-beta-dihydromenaquinone-9 sulfotransferase